MTQDAATARCPLGYVTPRRIVQAGFEAEYQAAMGCRRGLVRKTGRLDPQVAQYVVPTATTAGCCFDEPARAYAFLPVARGGQPALFDPGRVAQRVAEEIRRGAPAFDEVYESA